MRQATGNTGIQMSPWRVFDFGGQRRALIHLPTSTVLEVSERIFNAARGTMQPDAQIISMKTLKNKIAHTCEPFALPNSLPKNTVTDFPQTHSQPLLGSAKDRTEYLSEPGGSSKLLGVEDISKDEEALKFLNDTHLALGVGKSFELEPIDIRSIALNVEESCNLRCTYCYAGDGNYGHDSRMHQDIAIQSIAQLSKGKPKFHIAFFGGEPLLNFPLIKTVVLWCEEQKETAYSFGITTNATLLNSTHLAFFKDHKVSLKISYDGDKAQAIQRLTVDRKQNVATQVKRKIEKYYSDLETLGMSIRATFGKDGSLHFKDSLENLLEDFKSHVSYSKVASFDSKHSVTLTEVEAMGADLTAIIRKLINQKDYEKIMRITNIAASMKILHKGYVNRMTCGAGIGYISVSTKGEYFLCHRFTESPDEKIGDLKTGLNCEKLEEIQKYRAGQHAPCNTCWMQRYCRGGCFQENKVEHGELFKPSDIFCRMQEIELTLALEVYLDMKLNSPDLVEKFL